MDRRESIKSILLGSVGTGFLLQSCVDTTPEELQEKIWQYQYGRTPQEAAFDEKLFAEQFFTPTEMETITRMADIILPPHDKGSIAQADVPEFIEFIVKDIPEFQLPIRGGLMWLDSECSERFNKLFVACSEAEQKAIFDEIAFPVPGKKKQSQEVNFFSLMRDLVGTGYFTSEGRSKKTSDTWEIHQMYGMEFLRMFWTIMGWLMKKLGWQNVSISRNETKQLFGMTMGIY